jgi:hypothetical protein
MNGIRITRPMGNDIYWWRDTMLAALNELGVKVLDEFEVVPADLARARPSRSAPELDPPASDPGMARPRLDF